MKNLIESVRLLNEAKLQDVRSSDDDKVYAVEVLKSSVWSRLSLNKKTIFTDYSDAEKLFKKFDKIGNNLGLRIVSFSLERNGEVATGYISDRFGNKTNYQ